MAAALLVASVATAAGETYHSTSAIPGLGWSHSNRCGVDEARDYEGKCVKARISRSLFVFSAPPPLKVPIRPPRTLPDPKIHYNYVFIRTRKPIGGLKPIIAQPPEQKTLIYVLSKQPGEYNQEVIDVPIVPVEPEVYFVNYGPGDNPKLPGGISLQDALNQKAQQGQVIRGKGGINSNVGYLPQFKAYSHGKIHTSNGQQSHFQPPRGQIQLFDDKSANIEQTYQFQSPIDHTSEVVNTIDSINIGHNSHFQAPRYHNGGTFTNGLNIGHNSHFQPPRDQYFTTDIKNSLDIPLNSHFENVNNINMLGVKHGSHFQEHKHHSNEVINDTGDTTIGHKSHFKSPRTETRDEDLNRRARVITNGHQTRFQVQRKPKSSVLSIRNDPHSQINDYIGSKFPLQFPINQVSEVLEATAESSDGNVGAGLQKDINPTRNILVNTFDSQKSYDGEKIIQSLKVDDVKNSKGFISGNQTLYSDVQTKSVENVDIHNSEKPNNLFHQEIDVGPWDFVLSNKHAQGINEKQRSTVGDKIEQLLMLDSWTGDLKFRDEIIRRPAPVDISPPASIYSSI